MGALNRVPETATQFNLVPCAVRRMLLPMGPDPPVPCVSVDHVKAQPCISPGRCFDASFPQLSTAHSLLSPLQQAHKNVICILDHKDCDQAGRRGSRTSCARSSPPTLTRRVSTDVAQGRGALNGPAPNTPPKYPPPLVVPHPREDAPPPPPWGTTPPPYTDICRHKNCSIKRKNSACPMPVALPGLRIKPPIGQGGAEREHVAVRGAEQTHGHARRSCHHGHKWCGDMHHRALNVQRPAPKQVPPWSG